MAIANSGMGHYTNHCPTHSFFIWRMRIFFDKSVAGQSMCAGGTTSLAENGVPPSIIQPLGRWSSNAFLIYIQKSPALIQAMLLVLGGPVLKLQKDRNQTGPRPQKDWFKWTGLIG